MRRVDNVSYNPNSIIGKGGFGVVYLGSLDEAATGNVAVKCIPKGYVDLSVMKEEANLMLKASNHSNILRYICYKTNDDFL